MAVALKYLSPEERDEWAELLDASLNGQRQADWQAVGRLEAALVQADQAGRAWPDLVRRQWAREGMRIALKERLRSAATVQVGYDGRIVTKPARRGVVVEREDGSSGWQQVLFEDMTWEELAQARDLNREQIRALTINDVVTSKLLALHALAPTSKGPRDACQQLGTSIEAVLSA